MPTDILTPFGDRYPAKKRFKDMGDGTFAEVVAFTADSPVQLTGDVIVDTLGALNDAKATDPAAASATIPALLRGILAALSGSYETVAASQTDQVMGATGGAGDFLAGLLIVPTVVACGAVSIKDGGGSAITIFVGGGTTALADPKPFFLHIGLRSASGAWKVTTGANVSAIGIGNFT